MQAMHGPGLVVAMCDGSVRTIDQSVSCRESSNPDRPAGSVNFGCGRPDGVGDLLRVPNGRQPIPGDAL